MTKKDFTQIKEDVFQVFEKIEYRYNHINECSGIRTHFYDFDDITSGLQKSNLIILAARPSMGKTALALNITANVAIKSKVPVALFSLEMSREQLVQRMLCSEAEIDTQKLRVGTMQQKDWDELSIAMNNFAESAIYIDDTAGCTLADISEKCKRLVMEEKDLGLVVIDHLQLINSTNEKRSRNKEISAITRGLKTLSRELNLPIMVLSQLPQMTKQLKDKRPKLSDLNSSDAIEQNADIVMFMHRENYYRNIKNNASGQNLLKRGKSDIIIAKNRNGAVGDFELLFQANITKFKNPIKIDEFMSVNNNQEVDWKIQIENYFKPL